jgi:TonB family protein
MLGNKSYFSTVLSLLLHLLIIALPFSIKVNNEYKEDELLLFVIDDKKTSKPQPEKKNCDCENCNCEVRTINKKQKSVIKKQTQKTPIKQPQKIPPKKIIVKKIEKKAVKPVPKRKHSKTSPPKKFQQKKVNVDDSLVNEVHTVSEPIKPVEKNTQISSLPEDNSVGDGGDESLVSPLSDKITHKENLSAPAQSSNNQPENDIIETEFGSLEGPKFLHREIPRYPRRALRRKKEGKVLLSLTIDKKGNLINVNVEKDGGYGFAQSAINAVKKSTFLPAQRNGKPIACKCLLPVKFVLNK